MSNQLSVISSLKRAPFQSLTAFFVTFLSLFLGYVFFFVAAGSSQILRFFETRPQVNAYYKSDHIPSAEEIASAEAQLKLTGKILAISYVDKEKALEIYRQLNAADPLSLESVDSSMLPASIEVQATSPKDLKQIAEILKTVPNIDEVSYAEDVISSLETWTNSVRLIGIVLVGVLLLVSFMVMVLIIGLKISAKKSDIKTQQLLGAGKGFILAPFVREGLLYGSFSAAAAWMFSYLLLLYSTPFLVKFLAGLPVLPVSPIFLLATLTGGVVLGAAIGVLAGILAVHRFLKS